MTHRYQVFLFVLCFSLFAATSSFSQAAWTWAIKPIGIASTGFYNNSVSGVSIDDFGNVFFVGTLNNSATFSGIKYKASTHGLDMYIAKINSAGAFQWVRTGGSPAAGDKGIDVATDAAAVRIGTEEKFLFAVYPEYIAYAARTKRVIPFWL